MFWGFQKFGNQKTAFKNANKRLTFRKFALMDNKVVFAGHYVKQENII